MFKNNIYIVKDYLSTTWISSYEVKQPVLKIEYTKAAPRSLVDGLNK